MTEQEIDEALFELAQKGLLHAMFINGEIYYMPTEEGIAVADLIRNYGHNPVEPN